MGHATRGAFAALGAIPQSLVGPSRRSPARRAKAGSNIRVAANRALRSSPSSRRSRRNNPIDGREIRTYDDASALLRSTEHWYALASRGKHARVHRDLTTTRREGAALVPEDIYVPRYPYGEYEFEDD